MGFMDLQKIIRFKTSSKTAFTISVFSVLSITVSTLILTNAFIFNKNVVLLLSWDSLRNIFGLKVDKFWAPEPISLFLFGLLVLWTFVVLMPLIFFNIKQLASHSPWSKIINLIPKGALQNLIFQGNISVENDVVLRVTNADRGVLFKNIWWKDFKTTFKFNFEGFKSSIEDWGQGEIYTNNNYFGFLFRAQDLDNYFMVQIGTKRILEQKTSKNKQQNFKEHLLIRPHIRFDGNWEGLNEVSAQVKTFDENAFNSLQCIVRGIVVTVDLNNGEFIYTWNLPTNFRAGEEKKEEMFSFFGDSSKIIFREEFGMVGFRAYGDERVLIKNIKVYQL